MYPAIPRISSIEDVRRISQAPYADFMPHATVLAALAATAARHPDKVAITAIDVADLGEPVRQWTYAALVRDVTRAASLLRDLGGESAPRVGILLPPIPEAHIALWAAESAGTACPINYQLGAEHVNELLNACGANIVVALGPAPDLDIHEKMGRLKASCPALEHVLYVPAGPGVGAGPDGRDFMAEIAAYTAPREPAAWAAADRPAALFHTGGTTGLPKLARHSQANQLHAAWGAAQMYRLGPDDVVLNGFPLFHVAGSFVYGLSTLLAGGELVMPTRLGLRNAAFMSQVGAFVQKHRATILAAVPTVLAGILAQGPTRDQLSTVRCLLTGGSPLPPELASRFEARYDIPVRNILGMTECAGVISIEPFGAERVAGSCGLPLPFTEVRVVRADGSEAAVGESGVLSIRGPNVSAGYTDPARNAGTFEGEWLVSGDIGHVDEQGRIFVTGRSKDVIIRGAHNIDPGMIESVLLQHPAVLVAAAVGEPDAHAGEIPVAFVSLKAGSVVDEGELAAFTAARIAERPAMPKRITVLDAMPMTAIGKVYKPALRARAITRALTARLSEHGLGASAAVSVSESARGIQVAFEVADESTSAAVEEMMTPYPISFSVTCR